MGADLLSEHDERVAAAVLLLDENLVTWVGALVVQLQRRAEVMHRDITQRLHALLVLHRRLCPVQQQVALQMNVCLQRNSC